MTTVNITKRKLRYLYRTLRKHDKESKELSKLIHILRKALKNKFETETGTNTEDTNTVDRNNVEENIVYLHSMDLKEEAEGTEAEGTGTEGTEGTKAEGAEQTEGAVEDVKLEIVGHSIETHPYG